MTTRQVLHFVHGNSFATGTYRAFLEHLARDHEVRALEMHGHDPRYPVRNGWQALAEELIDALAKGGEQDGRQDRVILLGHSMGGMLSLMAAKARPDLVRAVILLDAPVIAGWRAALVRFAKHAGLDGKFPPAKFSARRRNVWASAEEAYRHFAAKPLFARWPQQVLRDYIAHGLAPHPDGVTLRFTRETETAIYRSLPHHLGALVKDGFPVPVGFIGGRRSVECRQAGLKATRRLVGRRFTQVDGGHLFPLESPAEAAEAVRGMIISLFQS